MFCILRLEYLLCIDCYERSINIKLLWRAACFKPSLKSSPGDFLGSLFVCVKLPFFPQMVSLFGVVGALLADCWRFWFFVAVFLIFLGVHLMLSTFIGADRSCIFFCLASSKQNLLIFSWFLLYSPTVLQATMCIRRGLFSTIWCVGSVFF